LAAELWVMVAWGMWMAGRYSASWGLELLAWLS